MADHSLSHTWRAFQQAAHREWSRAKEHPPQLFPHYSSDGRWQRLDAAARSGWRSDGTYDHGNWTAGFWLGIMWLLSLGGDRQVMELACERLSWIEPRCHDATTHDLGFLFYPSHVFPAVAGLLDAQAASTALVAASTLARRFNSSGGYIQAFGPVGDSREAGTSTIDTMMNLPLLWWAARNGGDIRLLDVARRHARTSARLFFRPDGSTYHLTQFDPLSGAVQERGTFQGANSSSCWSRGQAWAIAGFAWAYAATAEVEFLDSAQRAALWFWNHLPESGVPPWDFSDTDLSTPRDSSAAAVAALGAVLLGRIHPNSDDRERYRTDGESLLLRLGAACLNGDSDDEGILLHSCYSKPHGLGLDGAVAWGDFYYGLALALAADVVPVSAVLGFRPLIEGEGLGV